MDKNFGDLLRERRLEKGLSLRQVTIKTGISHSYISEIEKNRFFKRDTVEKLIDGLELNEDDKKIILKKLDYSNTPPEVLKELNSLKNSKFSEGTESNVDLSTGFREIPVYPSISAGLGLEHASCEEIEYIVVPNTKEFRGDVIGIRVNGDSMEYTIENGSIAFIKKGEEVANKKVGAFILNNKALLKRYMCMDESCFLRSDNREYSDIPVGANDDFYIVGKFIGSIDLYGDE